MNDLPLRPKTQRNSKQHQMRAESDAEKGWDNKKTKENNCISSVPSPVFPECIRSLSQILCDVKRFPGRSYSVLPVMSRGAGLKFNSRGFNETYADPSIENNQVNHFWFFVNAAYQLGPGATGTVDLFAVLHETDLPVIGGAAGGASIQDYHLSLLGIELGTSIYSGSIIPGEVADWIRDRIGR